MYVCLLFQFCFKIKVLEICLLLFFKILVKFFKTKNKNKVAKLTEKKKKKERKKKRKKKKKKQEERISNFLFFIYFFFFYQIKVSPTGLNY